MATRRDDLNEPSLDSDEFTDAGRTVGKLGEPELPEGVQVEMRDPDGALPGTLQYRVALGNGSVWDVDILKQGEGYRWKIAQDALGVENPRDCAYASERLALKAAIEHVLKVEGASPGYR